MQILAVVLSLTALSGNERSLAGRVLDRVGHGVTARIVNGALDRLVEVQIDPEDDDDSTSDSDDDLQVIPPPLAPAAPAAPPAPPAPPAAGASPDQIRDFARSQADWARAQRDWARAQRDAAHAQQEAARHFHFEFRSGAGSGAEARITELDKNALTVDVLHRIAQAAGWSLTIVGAPRERIDLELHDVPAHEALRAVLKASGAMGVLKRNRLVVVAAPDANAGLLVEKADRARDHGLPPDPAAPPGRKRSGRDVVRVLQGDITVEEGQVISGDVVCVGGSIELAPGAVVQGDAVAVGGSVSVDEGALVLGQAVAVMGEVDVAPGAQVMGEHVQVGVGHIFGPSRHRGWLSSLGPFGLFPTIALFALMYLLGLLALRMWPERVRNVSHAFFERPVRNLLVGFLCWLLLLPLVVLLVVSIVGIPLILLLPVAMFFSIVLGLSSLALRIGESLPAGQGERFVPPAALGMGMAVLLLLAFVPWLGISVFALLQFVALGASVSSRYGRALPPHAV